MKKIGNSNEHSPSPPNLATPIMFIAILQSEFWNVNGTCGSRCLPQYRDWLFISGRRLPASVAKKTYGYFELGSDPATVRALRTSALSDTLPGHRYSCAI